MKNASYRKYSCTQHERYFFFNLSAKCHHIDAWACECIVFFLVPIDTQTHTSTATAAK